MSTEGWATEAADRILDLNDIEIKVEGWNKDATRKRIASIIAAHAEPRIKELEAILGERLKYPSLAESERAAKARIDVLIALLRESKREHYHCDDSWYCCGACRAADHQLAESEHLGTTHERLGNGSCNCSASTWNAKVDAALTDLKSST